MIRVRVNEKRFQFDLKILHDYCELYLDLPVFATKRKTDNSVVPLGGLCEPL